MLNISRVVVIINVGFGGLGQVCAEGDACPPEFRTRLGADENAMVDLTGDDSAKSKKSDRDEHRPRAFVWLIAGGARRRRC